MRIKILLSLLFYVSVAFGDSNLTIYTDYNKTLKIAEKEDKPIFILFTKKRCKWCKKLKTKVLTTKKIEKQLKSDYIVLFLDKESDYYPSIYNVKGVPDVFLVSPKEEIYTEIFGYHSKPRDYLKWFNYVKIERE